MTWRGIWRTFCLLLLIVILYAAYSLMAKSHEGAQGQTPGKEGAENVTYDKKTFIELRDIRDGLDRDIRQKDQDLSGLNNKEYYIKEVDDAKSALKLTKSPQEKVTIENRIRDLSGNFTPTDDLEKVRADIEKAKAELKQMKLEKDKVDKEINRKLNVEKPAQDFKLWTSVIFASLIGLIIAGFFYITSRDCIVAREIFRAETGIQFITLFSVVIAIILFGILGILEGKELAALLGGLSGYILGKVGTSSGTPVQTGARLSSPVITGISPNEVTLGVTPTPTSVQIVGNGLQLANSVKIVQDGNEILVSGITSNDIQINCKLALDPNQAKGTYDVIVTNTDGAVAKLPNGFTVK